MMRDRAFAIASAGCRVRTIASENRSDSRQFAKVRGFSG
jgi:hypothetical protein